ncbi:hypothetical protein ACFL5Q_04850 [Planctomycetota bacterium]
MEQLQRQVRKAQRQLGIERFARVLGWCCLATMLLAVIAVVLDKFRPTGAVAWAWSPGALESEPMAAFYPAIISILVALAIGIAAAACWAIFRSRGPVDAAIEIDRRFRLKERVSSALAMSDQERSTPLGQALVDDAERRVRRIHLAEHFRISPGRQMFLPFIPVAMAVLAVLVISPAAPNQAQANTDAVVKKGIEESTKGLKRKLEEKTDEARKKGLDDAEDLFRRLEEGTDDLANRSHGKRKRALVKLNDLARQITERRQELGGSKQIRKQLNQLKNVQRGPADEFLKAVKEGDFNKAMQELEELKKQLAEGEMNKEDREKLAKQLDQMQTKLQKLAEAHRQAQEDLEKRVDEARREGRNEEADQLQQQLDALQQQRPQMDQLQNLANKLGQCAKCVRGGQPQDAESMLDSLQADVASLQEQLQEMEMLDEAMAQLGQCRNQMNCPQCQGMGCAACQGKIPGEGLGEGRGKGDRPEEENDVDFIETKPPMKVGPGAASVVGEVQGPNMRGDVQLEMKEQYEAARRQSTDPVTVEHLPRGYQDHALEYLDRLREGD